jgi:hypothetical protein
MRSPLSNRSRFLPWLIASALYFALALIVTWPAALGLSGALIGHHTGDAYEMGHHLWWYGYALKHGEPLFTQTLLGYPDGIGGISLWSNPLQFFPAWAFALVMPVALAYNLQVLLTMALNGLTMAYLMTRLAQRAGYEGAGRVTYGPALIAGAAFLAFPVFQGHLFGGHGGLMVMWPVPLFIDALFSLRDGFTWRRFIRAVVWCVISPWGHTLQLIYVVMPVTGVFVLAQLVSRDLRGAIRTAAAALTGAVILLAVFALPVASDAFDETYTGDQGYIAFSTDLLGLVSPSFESLLLGDIPYSRAVLGTNLIEGLTYYGCAAALLTIIAVWKRRESRWWLALGIVAAVLALGPIINTMGRPLTLSLDTADTYLTMPWAWLYKLPGFSLARTPGRFSFTLALAAAVLAGYGAAVLWRGRSRWIAVALAAVLLLEYQSFWPFPSVSAAIPAPIVALRERDDVRAVMDMPWGNLLAAKHGMYLQTGHEKPLIAGQVTRRTPVNPAKLTILETTLDPALMDESGVDAVILHKQYDDGMLSARLREAYGEPDFEDASFALYTVPDAVSSAAFYALGETESVPITQAYEMYFYVPERSLIDLEGSFGTSGYISIFTVMLDGEPIQRWTSDDHSLLHVPLFVETGYHTVSLAIDPPCPARVPSRSLKCVEAVGARLRLTPREVAIAAPVALGSGVLLQAAAPVTERQDGKPSVHLSWRFDAPISAEMVRFVKLLTPNGEEIGGFDSAPGPFAAGSALAETVTVDLPADFTGELEVYGGWYTYPDLARLPVQSDAKGAQDGLIYLGTVNVR